jgi:osmotically-inducible protein OsmY
MLPRRFVLAAVCGLLLQAAASADAPDAVQASDADITNRVVQKLVQADPRVAQRIRVSTLNGVVTLEGTVFTPSQILKVQGDTGTVTGVVQVKNRLHLQM